VGIAGANEVGRIIGRSGLSLGHPSHGRAEMALVGRKLRDSCNWVRARDMVRPCLELHSHPVRLPHVSPREAPCYRSRLEVLLASSPTIHPLNVRRSALWVGERPADGHVFADGKPVTLIDVLDDS